jgi:hypothetical protein
MAEVTQQDVQPFLEAIARAAHFSAQAEAELYSVLNAVRASCPDFYPSLLKLLAAAVDSHQSIEYAGDDLLATVSLIPIPYQVTMPRLK